MTENQYKVQMEEIKNYIANDLQAPQAAYHLILEMKAKMRISYRESCNFGDN